MKLTWKQRSDALTGILPAIAVIPALLVCFFCILFICTICTGTAYAGANTAAAAMSTSDAIAADTIDSSAVGMVSEAPSDSDISGDERAGASGNPDDFYDTDAAVANDADDTDAAVANDADAADVAVTNDADDTDAAVTNNADDADAIDPDTANAGNPDDPDTEVYTIEDDQIPMASFHGSEDLMTLEGPERRWSPMNLLLVILTVILSLLLLTGVLIGKASLPARIAGLVPAAASVFVFLKTEDLSHQASLMDSWTLAMAAIFCAEATLVLVANDLLYPVKRKNRHR